MNVHFFLPFYSIVFPAGLKELIAHNTKNIERNDSTSTQNHSQKIEIKNEDVIISQKNLLLLLRRLLISRQQTLYVIRYPMIPFRIVSYPIATPSQLSSAQEMKLNHKIIFYSYRTFKLLYTLVNMYYI